MTFYRFKQQDNQPFIFANPIFHDLPNGLTVSGVYKYDGLNEKIFHGFGLLTVKKSLIPSFYFFESIKLEKFNDEFDLFTLGKDVFVSEEAKSVIEEVDSFSHQFVPINVLDKSGNQTFKKRYYSLFIRRVVCMKAEQLEVSACFESFDFSPLPQEKPMLYYANEMPDTRKYLEDLPLWRMDQVPGNFFLSESIYKAFINKGLVGLKKYSQKEGASIENLGSCF